MHTKVSAGAQDGMEIIAWNTKDVVCYPMGQATTFVAGLAG